MLMNISLKTKFVEMLNIHKMNTSHLTLKAMGGGRCLCLLLKIIMRHSYMKILDLANLFVADAHMKKNKKFSFTPLSEHFEIWV